MARITSLNILLEQEGKDYLAELYGRVIENVQKNLVSANMKNQELSGDPASGSVEAKRFVNASSKAYGTARTAGKGDALKARPVVIQIDQDKEIVEELENKDIKLYGVDGVLDRRALNHVQVMAAELDKAFFACAATAGTLVADTDDLETIIQTAEQTKNDFVDGVPRSMMNLVLSPLWYGRIREEIDKAPNANISTADEEINTWHGVKVFSSVHLPADTNCLLIVDGAVAQPVMADQYTAEKIPLSNAYGVELFYHFGTAAVTPDLIYKA